MSACFEHCGHVCTPSAHKTGVRRTVETKRQRATEYTTHGMVWYQPPWYGTILWWWYHQLLNKKQELPTSTLRHRNKKDLPHPQNCMADLWEHLHVVPPIICLLSESSTLDGQNSSP
jgi:hypothetical protein